MNAILWWLAQNTITIAILVPIVAAACRTCRNRPAVQHMLWTVVLLKFLTPPLVSWPWPLERFGPPEWSILAPETHPRLTVPLKHQLTAVNGTSIEAARIAGIGGQGQHSRAVPFDPARQLRSFANREVLVRAAPGLFCGAWLIGIVFCTAREVRRISRHASLVRLATEASTVSTSNTRASIDECTAWNSSSVRPWSWTPWLSACFTRLPET